LKEAPLVRNPELGSSDDADFERSSGRGGSRNGGGRGQSPFNPPPHNYWKTFWKAVSVFAILLCLGGVGAWAYLNLTTDGRHMKPMIQGALEAKRNPNLIFERSGSDVVNILLIGRDVNWTIKKVYDPTRKIWARMQVHDEQASARSDTMIVMSLDKRRNEIHMVSLPRDARVHMPPNKYDVRRAKLNAAHAYGGPELLIRTVHDELGLDIHHYAVIQFDGFKNLIDEIGGVEVNVIGALKRNGRRGNLDYDDNWGNLHIHLKPGLQKLNGQQAHNYVRFRMDIEGDPGRIKRQQSLMRALAKSLMHQPFYKIPGMVQEIHKQFKTDMSNAEIASAADFAKNIGDASKIQPLTMFGTYTSKGTIILNKSKNIKLFSFLFGPTFDETHFLENSPSTEGDEMGEENNSSPGAKALLRRAGLIKGAPAEATPQSEVSSREISAPSSSSDDGSSRLAVVEGASTSGLSSSSETTERPRRRSRRRRSASSESTPAESSAASRPTLE
jgi:LCP family protein required for cell wall assembly